MYEQFGGFLVGGMDDTYMVDVFPLVNKQKEYLKEIGLVLNIGKTKFYIRGDFRQPTLFSASFVFRFWWVNS